MKTISKYTLMIFFCSLMYAITNKIPEYRAESLIFYAAAWFFLGLFFISDDIKKSKQ